MLAKIFLFNILLIPLSLSLMNATNLLRQKRIVKFPKGSAVGYIIALAIPTEDEVNNLFLAFNFEANFILPDYETSSSEDDSKLEKRSAVNSHSYNSSDMDVYSRVKESFTRANIYSALESQLFHFGLNGTACILKTICQTSEFPIYKSNGLLGSLFHIIFTPSSTKNENLPIHVYEAEIRGKAEKCYLYQSDCPISILDFILNNN